MTIRLDLLEIMGREYIMQHCAEYIRHKYDERRYRAYVTDALMAIVGNTAHMFGGAQMNGRWVDEYKPEDTRTGEEIAEEVIRRAGLRKRDGE